MRNLSIVLLVIFVACMLFWAFALLGTETRIAAYSGWVAFVAVLDLGLVVYLSPGSPPANK